MCNILFTGIILFILNVNFCTAARDQDTLELVHVIFRHGNRTTIPDMIYPSDPHINETYYPFGQAELTLEGKRNAYNFGVEIRARYQSFLNETYFPPEIKAFTSNISRTQMTLQSVLTAMYPPIYPNVVLPYLMWQPISYETIPTNDDTLIMVNCSKKLETPVKRDQELQNLYDYVSAHAGKKMIDSNDIMNVYNTILVEKQNGFPVPDWAEEIFNNGKLQDAALSLWVDIIEQQLPIISGNLIRKITEDSVKKTKNEIANQIFLYSGHDTTVAGMLGVFDAYTKFELEYLSHVYIELHKIDDVYGFKVYFQNGPGNELRQLKFKKCSKDFCKMKDFIESTKHLYIPEPVCY